MVFTTPDGKTFETKKEWKKHYLSLLQFKDVSDTHEGLVRRAPIVSGQGFEIENVKNCTIMVLDHSEQVQIDAVEDSKIFIGACCSSVFIRDCKNCTFTVACKQLRTRDCDNIEINLFCISEPVVEATTNARIHPFNGSYAGIADSFKAANLNVEQNTWYKVFDFSKDDTSLPQPHFTVIRKRNPEWRVEGGEGVNANPVPVESDTATDADDDAAGGGGAATGEGGSFNFNQTQEEVEAILAQQAAKDAEAAAAQAEGAVPLPEAEGGDAAGLPVAAETDAPTVTEIAQAANAAGFATDENNIRFILEKLAEAQQQGRITQ